MRDNKSNKQKKKEQFDFNIATWCSFWRENPHRLIVDYFGVKIFLFQQILIYFMFKSEMILLLAARGLRQVIHSISI